MYLKDFCGTTKTLSRLVVFLEDERTENHGGSAAAAMRSRRRWAADNHSSEAGVWHRRLRDSRDSWRHRRRRRPRCCRWYLRAQLDLLQGCYCRFVQRLGLVLLHAEQRQISSCLCIKNEHNCSRIRSFCTSYLLDRDRSFHPRRNM